MIYFITDGVYTKIGKSKNPYKRLKGLQTSNAKNLRFEYIFDIEDKYEKKIHKKLKKYKTSTNNEWFDLRNICLKTKLNFIDNEVFKDKKKASHLALLINKKIYGNINEFRNLNQNLNQIKKNNYNKKDKSNIKKMLDEIRMKLKNSKYRISYNPLMRKYGFTKAEISYYIKSAKLSKKIFIHNNKI